MAELGSPSIEDPSYEHNTIEELWHHGFEFSRDHVRDYHLNHAFLEGHQWLEWHPVELMVQGLPDDIDRIQATMNHLRANTRTIISQLTQRALTFEVVPSAYDDATIRSSKVGEALLRDLHEDHNWERVREGVLKATLKGGTGAVCVDWSETNKTSVERVLSISEFVVEPGAQDAEHARWWIRQQLLPPKEVQAMFSEHFKMSPPEADGRVGYSGEYNYRAAQVPLTRVFTYYERPNPLCPKGKVCVEVNGKRLQEGEWPFPWSDRLNIAVMTESLIENQAYGSTVLSDARGPQTALNAAWSGFLEHVRESSNHRMVLDESWTDAVDLMNDRAGSIMTGPLQRGKPEYLKAPPVPTGLLDAIQLLKMEIDNLLGVHDVSRGQAPSNIESGLGLSILAEKDSSPVGRLIKETARLFSRVGYMVLALHEQEVTEKRTASIHDGSAPAVREWKGSDINGQTRALVPLEAIIPKSQAAQQQWAQNALQMGLISPEDPLAVMRFAKLADMPDQRGIIYAVLPDADKATRENEAVVLDEVPLPREFDDHQIHIVVHNEFRKSLQYDLLSDEQRADIDNHIKAHEKMIQKALGERRLGSEIDPELGMMPRADGAPPIEQLPPAGLSPEEQVAMEQASSLQEASPAGMPDVPDAPEPPMSGDDLVEQILGAMEAPNE